MLNAVLTVTRHELSVWTKSAGRLLDLKVSQRGEWHSLTGIHCAEIFKATPAFISPRLTCCSPLKHDIHREVPRDFPKSNINTSMFSVHKLKLKITCSCLSAKCNMHSKTCLHLLQSDSKHTQLSLLWCKALDSSSTALALTSSQLCYGLRLPAIVC